ncbi:hypothetical protein HDU85_007788 [Gaertneriomyces sp. JEL0708]|nr:hypothetical protein HDU85_007788 [Gaertneriomyces sp. JEL0708]
MACIGHYAWRGWSVSRVHNQHIVATKLLSRGTPTQSSLARLLRTTPSPVTSRALRRPAAGSSTVDREKPFPEEPNFDDESIPPPRPQGHRTVLKPVLFTAGIVLLSFGTGSYLQARKRWDAEDKGRRFILPSWEWPDVRGGLIQQRPQSGSAVRDMYDLICDRWKMLGSAKRTVYTIIAINVGVWMLWQLPHARSKAFMMRHFTHHPGSGRSYTMLTCMFSHESFMHLLFNMYALSGFAPVLQDRGFQGSTEQFVAFYLSTGMLSSLGSHLVGTYRAMSNHVLKPSLGASGAVWAVVAGYVQFEWVIHV